MDFLPAVAQAVTAINLAVEEGDSAATLEALKAPAAGIRSVTDECAEDYVANLAPARTGRSKYGDGWTEHRTREGYMFYYNWHTSESQWECPEDMPEQSPHLTREEIQVCVWL